MARATPNPRGVSRIDIHVANRVRERRIMKGVSLREIADMVGVSLQQVQKYESGADRLSVGRLYLIAKALATSPGFFFEGLS